MFCGIEVASGYRIDDCIGNVFSDGEVEDDDSKDVYDGYSY